MTEKTKNKPLFIRLTDKERAFVQAKAEENCIYMVQVLRKLIHDEMKRERGEL